MGKWSILVLTDVTQGELLTIDQVICENMLDSGRQWTRPYQKSEPIDQFSKEHLDALQRQFPRDAPIPTNNVVK